MAKFGPLSLVSRVTRRRIIKMFVTYYQRNLMKKYQKLAEIFSKNLENHGFFVYHPSNNGPWQAPRADKVSKIFLKVVQEDFGNTCKKSHWLHLPFFSQILLRSGGGITPPMLLTVNVALKSRMFEGLLSKEQKKVVKRMKKACCKKMAEPPRRLWCCLGGVWRTQRCSQGAWKR